MEHARKNYGEIISCLSDLKEVGLNGCPVTLGQELFAEPSSGFHELDDLLLELKLKTDQITGKFVGHEKIVASMLIGLYETTTAYILNLREENRKPRRGRKASSGPCECVIPLRMDCLALLYDYRDFLWKWGNHAIEAAKDLMLGKYHLRIPATETNFNPAASETEEKKANFPGKRKIPKVVAMLYVMLKEHQVFDRMTRTDFITLCKKFVKGNDRVIGGYVNVLYPNSTENREKYPTWDYVEPARKLLKNLRII